MKFQVAQKKNKTFNRLNQHHKPKPQWQRLLQNYGDEKKDDKVVLFLIEFISGCLKFNLLIDKRPFNYEIAANACFWGDF